MPAFFAHGTTITFASQAIGKVVGITLPSQTKGEVETTNHGSGNVREFVAGLRDSGTVTLTCRLDPDDAGQVALRTNYDTAGNAVGAVVITLPTSAQTTGSTTFSFDAYVSEINGDLPGDTEEAASVVFTLRVTGAVTQATA